MVPVGNRKWYTRKAVRAAAGMDVELKELQTLLGLIHDSDITIKYLRGRSNKQLLNKEIVNRAQLYKKFVRYMKK